MSVTGSQAGKSKQVSNNQQTTNNQHTVSNKPATSSTTKSTKNASPVNPTIDNATPDPRRWLSLAVVLVAAFIKSGVRPLPSDMGI